MEQLDDRSETTPSGDSQAAENVLRTVTQDLKSLQQDLVAQFHQDIRRLQAEKSRLLNDIEKLQNQQQTLQSQYETALSRQQIAQQQAWAKQLALVLANHLHTALNDRLSQMLSPYQSDGTAQASQLSTQVSAEGSDRILASIDETVNRAFLALRHDLNSYQSSLSQQISRMQDLGQQGEALLEVLVGRISQQIQLEAAAKTKTENRAFRGEGYPAPGANQISGATSTPAAASYSSTPSTGANSAPGTSSYSLTQGNDPLTGTNYTAPRTTVTPSQQPSPVSPDTSAHVTSANSAPANAASGNSTPANPASATPPSDSPAIASQPESMVSAGRSSRSQKLSQFQFGVVLVLLSTLALSLHNVAVFLVSNAGNFFGTVGVGGYLKLNNLDSALLLLWTRMLVVVPLMAWLAGRLYAPTWRDVRAFSQAGDRRTLWSVIASGFFLFLSQTFIYVAIGQLGPGVAVTLLFAYPLLLIPLTWFLFGDRPTRLRLIVLLMILAGVGLTLYPQLFGTNNVPMTAINYAIAAGVAFTLYLLSVQISFRKLHPVPVSLIQFLTMFVLASISLIALGIDVAPTNWIGLAGSGLVLGGLTTIGYFFNDWGIRFMGAARAALIATSVPALTALLAFLLIPGALTALHAIQIVGILAVTLAGAALALERLLIQAKSANRKGASRRAKPEKVEA